MGALALGDPCQPLGTFPIITAPEGLLDRKHPQVMRIFLGQKLGHQNALVKYTENIPRETEAP